MSFSKHVNDCIKSVSYKVYLLAKIRKYLNVKTSVLIYKSMILPHIDNGDIVYEAATKAALCKLQKLQNKALRICLLSDPRASTTLVHQQTRTPFLGPRRIAHLRKYMYSKQTDYNLVDNRDIRTRTRNATTFKVTFPKKRNLRRTLCLGVPWIGMHSTYTQEILILSFLLKRSKKNGRCCKMKYLSNWDVY